MPRVAAVAGGAGGIKRGKIVNAVCRRCLVKDGRGWSVVEVVWISLVLVNGVRYFAAPHVRAITVDRQGINIVKTVHRGIDTFRHFVVGKQVALGVVRGTVQEPVLPITVGGPVVATVFVIPQHNLCR